MSTTLTIRVDDELIEWLEELSRATGVSRGQIVREQLFRARREGVGANALVRFAGTQKGGPRDVSGRKGFAR